MISISYYLANQTLDDDSDTKNIYSLLKEVLLNSSPEYQFRGPAKLEKQNFKYQNHQYDSLDRVHGIERIYKNNEQVYVLYCHGGKFQKALQLCNEAGLNC